MLISIAISAIIGFIVSCVTGNSIIGWIVGILLFLFGLIGEVFEFIFGRGKR